MDFFAELEKLQMKGPRLGMLQLTQENSEYTFATDQCKNCYLIANAVRNEDCMYGRDFYNNDDCVDCDHISGSQLCYECINCKNCYNGDHLQDCENSRDCSYGYDLKACTNCVGCVGFRKKEFHIFNEPYSKEAYFEKLKTLTLEEIQTRFLELKESTPRMFTQIINSENATGNYVYNSRNVFESFDVSDCQDIGHSNESKKLKDSWDIYILENSELCYEIACSHVLYNSNFCYMCVESSDLEYCEFVAYSKNCFGCVSLIRKDYHILNEPHSKEDYFLRLKQIKNELRARGEYGRRNLPFSYPFPDTVGTWSSH